jgi:hypothetical protein
MLHEQGANVVRRTRGARHRGGGVRQRRHHQWFNGGAIEPSKTFTKIGEPEGALELIAWAGYVEDGTSEGGEDFDWVTPFEDATGCQVNVTYGDTSDEMVTLMRQGGGTVYDGVSPQATRATG